ncbi:MAG: iron ABC transporter permease [Spirochaetia bacterium]|nr:iron ABC transporter permease [Spirochaetia bacterium]
MAYPLASLFVSAFNGSLNSDGRILPIINLLIDSRTWKAVVTSISMAIISTCLTVFVALVLAVLVARTDMPGKRFVHIFIFIAFAIPSYVLALSWIQLAGRNGYIDRLWNHLGWHYGMTMMPYSVFSVGLVLSVHMLPITYFALYNALLDYDRSLEEAALLSGAGKWHTLVDVTVPLLLPQLVSISSLVFGRIIANFDVPAALGLPVGKRFLSTQIYASLSSLKLGEAAGLSLLLVITVTAICSFGRKRLIGKSFEVHHSSQNVSVCFSLGRWRFIVMAVVLFVLVCLIAVPLVCMVASSFLKRWGLPFKSEYLTFSNYIELFSDQQAKVAFRNSFLYGATGIGIASFIALHISLLPADAFGRKYLVRLVSFPLSIPNLVLAVAAITAWNRKPIRLYGSAWAIIVTYAVLFTPIILNNINGLVAKIDWDKIAAARLAGASQRKSMRDIVWPLLEKGIRSGSVLCFIIALREIPISLLLYAAGQQTVGVLLFGMQSQSYGLEMTSTLAVVLIGCIMLLRFLIIFIGKRS